MEIMISQDKCYMTSIKSLQYMSRQKQPTGISTENEKIAELIFSFDAHKKKSKPLKYFVHSRKGKNQFDAFIVEIYNL